MKIIRNRIKCDRCKELIPKDVWAQIHPVTREFLCEYCMIADSPQVKIHPRS